MNCRLLRNYKKKEEHEVLWQSEAACGNIRPSDGITLELFPLGEESWWENKKCDALGAFHIHISFPAERKTSLETKTMKNCTFIRFPEFQDLNHRQELKFGFR